MVHHPFINQRLFCPGPTPVSREATQAGLRTTIYHRTPEFYSEFQQCQKLLAPFFGTTKTPIILTCSGTGAMEAAMTNLTAPGDTIIVIEGGKFGERWRKMGTAYGCDVKTFTVPWGASPDLGDLRTFLKGHTNAKAFFMQVTETSTGVSYPLADIIQLVKQETQALVILDAISGLVAESVAMDQWGVDCVLAGSQKGLGIPPGLAFLVLSDRAVAAFSLRPRFYFDLKREMENQKDGMTAWTPATTLIASLKVALEQLAAVGVSGCLDHHQKLARACRSGVKAMGFDLLAQSHPANGLTAVALPSSIDGGKLVKHLQSRYGIIAAGGQDQLKGKIIRLAHLGFVDPFDLITVMSALELALHDLSALPKPLGSGVGAALQQIASSP